MQSYAIAMLGPMPPPAANPRRPGGPRGTHTLLVLLVCLAVYWPFLGYSGLALSEGVRAVPGWEMLESGDFLVTRLFGQLYLRKPPGMPWAVAGMSSLLGATEFAARAVSALATTLAALLSLALASRWFGRAGGRWGLAAGVLYALTPLFWYPGRSAEIEALHNLATLVAMGAIVDLLVFQGGASRGPSRAAVASTLALAAGLFAMLLVKGPAGLPCVAGAIAGACIARRSVRPLARPGVWVGLLLGLAAAAFTGWRIYEAVLATGETPITQPAGHFLWRRDRLGGILGLPVSALGSALPGSIAVVVALLPPLRRRGAPGDEEAMDGVGLALAWACVVAMGIYLLAGVGNDRYVMPALTVVPLVAAFAMARHPRAGHLAHLLGWVVGVGQRRLIAIPLVLLVAAVVNIALSEHRRETRTSGRAAGLNLGDLLEDRAEVWAWEMIDHHPEIFWYARARAAERGRRVTVRWKPPPPVVPGPSLPMPPVDGYLTLRTDERPRDGYPAEFPLYVAAGLLEDLEPIHAGRAHNFTFTTFRRTR